MLALVHPGEEVILFDPSYDSYAPAVLLAGGPPDPHTTRAAALSCRLAAGTARNLLCPYAPGHGEYAPQPDGNRHGAEPTSRVLAELLRSTDALVLADEVYEHMIYDGVRHAGILGHAELFERGVAVFSFGKTMHATGWRIRLVRSRPPGHYP